MTKLNYLDDTYLFESKAMITEILETEKGTAIIMDETIFYPQGGGQPADCGTIVSQNLIFDVSDVRMDACGKVFHFGTFKSETFEVGKEAVLNIDGKTRIENAKLHSAGHLLDCAVMKLQLGIASTKGFHFSSGAYVEFEGLLENKEGVLPEIERTMKEFIEKDLSIVKDEISAEEAKERGVWAPAGKRARIVNFEGFLSYGCGGTHVHSAAEIGNIVIRKIKSRKGMTKISYKIE